MPEGVMQHNYTIPKRHSTCGCLDNFPSVIGEFSISHAALFIDRTSTFRTIDGAGGSVDGMSVTQRNTCGPYDA